MSAAAERRPASAVPEIKGLHFLPMNIKAALVNISATGLLAEMDVTLKVGQSVKVRFDGSFVPHMADAEVVRSNIAGMTSSGFRYHVALSFKVPLPLDGESPPAAGDIAPAVDAPAAGSPPPREVVNRW